MLKHGKDKEVKRQDTKQTQWQDKEEEKKLNRAACIFGRNCINFYKYIQLRKIIFNAIYVKLVNPLSTI